MPITMLCNETTPTDDPMKILGHDIDGQPLREGETVEIAQAPHPCFGISQGDLATISGPAKLDGLLALNLIWSGHALCAASEKLRKI